MVCPAQNSRKSRCRPGGARDDTGNGGRVRIPANILRTGVSAGALASGTLVLPSSREPRYGLRSGARTSGADARTRGCEGPVAGSGARGAYPGRPPSPADGRLDRRVGELDPGSSGLQQQCPTAHVAATDEVSRKEEPLAEHLRQRADVLVGGHAAEEDEARARSVGGGHGRHLLDQGAGEPRVASVDRHLRPCEQSLAGDSLVEVPQPLAGSDPRPPVRLGGGRPKTSA